MTTSKFPVILAAVAAIAFTIKHYNLHNVQVLTGDEIKQLFTDATVQGHHQLHRYDFISYYSENEFRSYQNDAKDPRLGKWWVTDSGDICIRWKTGKKDLCRQMIIDNDGVYKKVQLGFLGQQKLIVTFGSFEEGNDRDL